MRRIEARIPTRNEFEAMMLKLDCDIVEVREAGDDETYLMYIGRHLVEVPARSWWRIRETTSISETVVECFNCGNRWTKKEYEEMRPVDASDGWCPSCGEDGGVE